MQIPGSTYRTPSSAVPSSFSTLPLQPPQSSVSFSSSTKMKARRRGDFITPQPGGGGGGGFKNLKN